MMKPEDERERYVRSLTKEGIEVTIPASTLSIEDVVVDRHEGIDFWEVFAIERDDGKRRVVTLLDPALDHPESLKLRRLKLFQLEEPVVALRNIERDPEVSNEN